MREESGLGNPISDKSYISHMRKGVLVYLYIEKIINYTSQAWGGPSSDQSVPHLVVKSNQIAKISSNTLPER